MDVQTASLGLIGVGGRDTFLHKPCKTIAHARLPGFIPRKARDDAVLYHTADTWDLTLLRTQQHMTIGGAHDDHHPPWFENRRCRDGDMGIYIGNRNGRAWIQPGPACRLLGQIASLRSQGGERTRHLLV